MKTIKRLAAGFAGTLALAIATVPLAGDDLPNLELEQVISKANPLTPAMVKVYFSTRLM